MHYRLLPRYPPLHGQSTIIAALSQALGEDEKQELRRELARWFEEKASARERGTVSCC